MLILTLIYHQLRLPKTLESEFKSCIIVIYKQTYRLIEPIELNT